MADESAVRSVEGEVAVPELNGGTEISHAEMNTTSQDDGVTAATNTHDTVESKKVDSNLDQAVVGSSNDIGPGGGVLNQDPQQLQGLMPGQSSSLDDKNESLHDQTFSSSEQLMEDPPAETATSGISDVAPTSSSPTADDGVPDDDEDDDDLFGGDDNEDDDEKDTGINNTEAFVEASATASTSETVVEVSTEQQTMGTTNVSVADPEASTAAISGASIPRKSSSSGGPSPESKKKALFYTKAALTALGLPDGVNVPYSVDKERLLNNNPNNLKMMSTLRNLPVKLINDALTECDDAVAVKGNTVRNHGAYLYGVVKRYVAVHERAIASGPDGSGVLPMGDGLTVAVNARLEQLVSSGFCSRDEMNDKVKNKIKMLPEKDALFALDELSSVPRTSIRNFGSYFMGILNRYMRRADDNKNTGGNQFHPSSPQLKHGMMNQQQRGRDRNSSYRDDRDRSRDRFGNNDDSRRFPPPNPQPPYDSRQQQQQPSWQQNLSQPSPYQPQYGNASGPRSNVRPDQQQPAGMIPGMPQQYNPLYQQPSNPSNPYQPQQQQQSNQTNQFVLPQAYQPGQPQQPQPQYQQTQQPQPQYQQQPAIMAGNQPYNSSMGAVQQPYMQQQQPPQQFQMNMANQQQSGVSSFGRTTNQPQQGISLVGQPSTMLDIMGLADKAASAVQALQNRPVSANIMQSYGAAVPPQQQQPQQQLYNQQSYQQQPLYGAGQSVLSAPQYPMGGTMPGAQTMPQQQQPQQSVVPQQQYSSPALPQNSYVNNRTSQVGATQDHNRRRTTASLTDLNPGVQYAIQNLIATRAIEGPLDDGILGMIHDLPHALAIASLQKFATLDKSNMRNRTAYLAGVLRRELEKIQRR